MRPLLAATHDVAKPLTYPLFASPKLDGVRCLIYNGVAVTSRKLKPIPNLYIQSRLVGLPNGLDGELIVGSPTSPTVRRDTISGCMAKGGEPDFSFYVFDNFAYPAPYSDRNRMVARTFDTRKFPEVQVVPQTMLFGPEELVKYEEDTVGEGYEGVMVRSIDGPYKQGRSTLKEGTLIKVKRFMDEEFPVVGFEELMINQNEQTRDKLGLAERSTAKAGKVPGGVLGALKLVVPSWMPEFAEDAVFNCGSGFTAKERVDLWAERDRLAGRMARVKFFNYGRYDVPQFPTFLDFVDVTA